MPQKFDARRAAPCLVERGDERVRARRKLDLGALDQARFLVAAAGLEDFSAGDLQAEIAAQPDGEAISSVGPDVDLSGPFGRKFVARQPRVWGFIVLQRQGDRGLEGHDLLSAGQARKGSNETAAQLPRLRPFCPARRGVDGDNDQAERQPRAVPACVPAHRFHDRSQSLLCPRARTSRRL